MMDTFKCKLSGVLAIFAGLLFSVLSLCYLAIGAFGYTTLYISMFGFGAGFLVVVMGAVCFVVGCVLDRGEAS